MRTLEELPRRLVIAIGGNATHPEDIAGTSQEQKAVARRTAKALLQIAQMDTELIITHGNGPVVGKIMMRQMLTMDRIPPMSMDICVAHSQGGISYLLMQAMENALRKVGNPRHVASLMTQVEVDPDDPAFSNPTKFVGPFFSKEEAERISAELDWLMKEDSGRGWRHVVPSPKPKHICDISLVDALIKRGTIVIAGGGGGIPVVRSANGVRDGLPAVIDKDLTSAHMANILGIKELLILTAVPRVAVDFGKPSQRELANVTLDELRAYRDQGHFPPGSMGPKVDAAIRFLENGGQRAIISDLECAVPALLGETGTHVTH
ncbi:carbamate kinase [Mesorhizobium xinjiangense]|uniref:carbamate kinase n=1 Tax=Mesorhizobium xinjiangense TaxID=2678685 RepID=UPI0012ECE697|nr:carbamate kinase [Mesorhizobium xinjiangense]